MLKLIINGKEVEVEAGLTVMQACELAGIEIPHFCFHERLNIAGNCRMCLVEIDKSPKPIASCAMPASHGMVIHTNTPSVQKAREGVMEFLLINHPLDCPICDQGGECDLQDQAFKYGKGSNRFKENKRSIKDKYFGPLIKTHMTRCIHCTRCVRFATEVAGVEEVGAIYRGEDMEITSYLEKALTSELSGNMIDLCPVGALTSKPFAFKARSWELERTETIDVMDAMGSNIVVESRGLEIMRILPKVNEEINEEWLSDKARFSYDGLKNMRLDRPYVKKNGRLVECSWEEAFTAITQKLQTLKGEEIAAIAGQFACVESMFLLKKLLASLNCKNIDNDQFKYKFDTTSRGNYLFNSTIEGIEKSDMCLLIGANPRQNAPVLNARIGKMQRLGKMKVARIGEQDDQTYRVQELGNDPEIIKSIMDGTHDFSLQLEKAQYPMVIIGDGIYSREDSAVLMSLIQRIAEKYNIIRDDWNGFNILHNHASAVGSLDVGFSPQGSGKNTTEISVAAQEGSIKLIYLLGADEIDTEKLENAFIIYQGHHGDTGANIADVILPGCAYTEKSATYVNLEGRVQQTRPAVPPPALAREDWTIIKEIASSLGINFNIADLKEVRMRMANFSQIFTDIDVITPASININPIISKAEILRENIKKVPINYYMTNSISRASITMANCTKALYSNGKENIL